MSDGNRATSVPIELRPFFVADVRFTGRELGWGSYGSVEETEIQGATCVVKKLHEELLPAATEAHGADIMIQTFVKECQLMSTLRHPHIVQFLGVCFPPGEWRLPALLMEKLMTDLHTFLESSKDIPLSMKRSILVDVAKGLSYLHSRSPPVIHRDLTARNVLLNSAMVAKIADLGNSRIINVGLDQLMTMTKTPGNVCYMPPEALEEHSQYNKSIDIFSFGNLTLFTLTEAFPKVKNATFVHPTTRRLTARSEIERRSKSMDQILQAFGSSNPLVQLAQCCLQDDPQNRPSIAAVLQHLERSSLVPYRSWDANKLEMVKDIVTNESLNAALQQQALHSGAGQKSSERERTLELQLQEAERQTQVEYTKRRESEDITRQLQELADTSERREREAIASAQHLARESQRSVRVATIRAQQFETQALDTQRSLKDATMRAQQFERQALEAQRSLEESTMRAQQFERQALDTQRSLEEATMRAQQFERQALEAQRSLEEATARAQQYQSQAQEAERSLDTARMVLRGQQFHRNGEEAAAELRLDAQWVVKPSEIELTGTEIGRGAWGKFEVVNFRGTRVAAKSLHEVIMSEQAVRLFRQQMKIASSIRHPNLVQFIGASVERKCFILFELMSTNLRETIVRRGISFNHIDSISLDVAKALNYLHQLQPDPIIHRDLSSTDVLLDPAPNNTWKTKVSGYGTMVFLSQVKRGEVHPGIPVYAAPEAGNPAQHSPGMDVYSFGILLLEMCTGEFPYPSKRDDQIRSIPEHGTRCLIQRCIRGREELRPSAGDLIAELRSRSTGLA